MASDTGDLPYWVGFTLVPNVGRVRVGMLERHFGSLEAAWLAPADALRAAGLPASIANAVVQTRLAMDPRRELQRASDAGVHVLTWHDDSYPPSLRDIPDLPPVLYMKGTLMPGDLRSITVVGTRTPTSYGREAAHQLASDLVRSDVTVVSGLARGIDGVAHRAALQAGGRTVAILGSGLDVIYPPEHRQLAHDIEQNGAVLSEHPLGAKPEARNFPRRNRLLSGLSLGTLVIEAAKGSGTLSTVKHALEQNRDVFCVPGNIYSPASELTNALIQEGAKPVMRVEDILEELRIAPTMASREGRAPQPTQPLSAEEAAILDALDFDPRHMDEVCRATGFPIRVVSGALAMMEMNGLVRQVGRLHYIRSRGGV